MNLANIAKTGPGDIVLAAGGERVPLLLVGAQSVTLLVGDGDQVGSSVYVLLTPCCEEARAK